MNCNLCSFSRNTKFNNIILKFRWFLSGILFYYFGSAHDDCFRFYYCFALCALAMCVRIHNHFVLVLVARALCLWRKSNDSEFIEIKFPWLSIKCVDIIFWHNESFRFFFILCFSPCFYSLTLNLICLKILVKFQVLNLFFFFSLWGCVYVCMCVPCVCYYLLPHFAFDVYIDQMKIDRLIPKVMICFI